MTEVKASSFLGVVPHNERATSVFEYHLAVIKLHV